MNGVPALGLRTVSIGAPLAAALVFASAALAAAPNYVLVTGPGLARPVLLANWSENGALLSDLVNAPFAPRSVVRGLKDRVRLRLSEFWGWGGKPPPTRPSEANQYGWFYPARHGQRAVFAVMVNGTQRPRFAPSSALRILARHRIPIRE
jgi:hypothetical protein